MMQSKPSVRKKVVRLNHHTNWSCGYVRSLNSHGATVRLMILDPISRSHREGLISHETAMRDLPNQTTEGFSPLWEC